ncbi:hypothetical protein ACSQ67_023097 [Phaseolus vulgaris]
MLGKKKVAKHVLTGQKVIIEIFNRRKIKSMEMEEQDNNFDLLDIFYSLLKLELEILRLLKHPRIIELYEVIETPSHICVVMEYTSKELFDYVIEKGRLEEDEARNIFQQVICGKLDSGPEVDVWSCGVVLYFILCGALPFDDETIPNLFDKIKGGVFSLPCYLSAEARDLIAKMLNVEPMKRMTISEIQEHPWPDFCVVFKFTSRLEMDGPAGRGGAGLDMFLPNYKLGKTLGIGSFGKVKIAEHVLTGHKVAIKILNRRKIKSMEMEEKVRREIKILRLFMHPHIIRLYEVIETPSDIYVVMEYVKSGELFDYIVEKGRLQEDEARNFFQQIISGVEYCHRNMVVHRDLKPENLLLDSKCNVKIADFGLSNIMRDGHFLKTSCGSPNYAAPEVISGKLYAGPEVDVWSCGVILYALLCGMLVVDPMRRMTIPEIRQHPWFQARLPRYLAIDEEILQEVVKMGFDRNQLVESLRNRIQNEGTVAYYLLLDNRFRVSSGYLGAEFQESMDSSFNQMHSSEVASSVVGQRFPGYMDYPGVGSRPQFPVERKWALGLQSRAHPREIMTEVLKALQELNVCWKKIGHYNMKCRWVAAIPGHHEGMVNNNVHSNHYFADDSNIIENEAVSTTSNVVKFEVQLYKTREEKYLLDLQRVQGPQFLFLDLCAAFLAQLRVL